MTPKEGSEVHQALGAAVKAHRMAAGISQGDLAGRVGVSVNQVSKYESGKNRITADMLHRIAEAIGAPLTAFFEGNEMDSAMAAQFSRLRIDLVRNFDRITDPGARSDVVRLAARLAEPKE